MIRMMMMVASTKLVVMMMMMVSKRVLIDYHYRGGKLGSLSDKKCQHGL